jgi:hypothetical protein
MASQHHSLLEPVTAAARIEIQQLMDDTLRSVPFRTSRQCQDLFRYIVEHSLAGSDDSLRERLIGVEVFGRAPDYDTSEDPVVRVRAADVRKRLAQYYQAQKNETSQWRIEIPTGSYKAQFHRTEPSSPHSAAVPTVVVPQPEVVPKIDERVFAPSEQPRSPKLLWMLAIIAGCVGIISGGLFFSRNHYTAPTAFDQFWAPVLENSRPVLVCTGSNRVYVLPLDVQRLYRKTHPLAQEGTPNMETLVSAEDLKKFTGEQFVPVKDTYLTIGDAAASAQISSLLTSRHHAFDLRFGSDLSFGDLREGSAVLIGAFNNSWTLNMTDNLRYVFDAGDTPQMHVQDRFDQSRSWWPKFSGRNFTEDYAIVSRILNSKTGTVLVTIAGLDHTGTRAAAEFVSNPQTIAELMKQAPKDWSRKSLQIVLHTNVVNGIPSSPTVVAVHYW